MDCVKLIVFSVPKKAPPARFFHTNLPPNLLCHTPRLVNLPVACSICVQACDVDIAVRAFDVNQINLLHKISPFYYNIILPKTKITFYHQFNKKHRANAQCF